jgi:uncharacterized membrane protein
MQNSLSDNENKNANDGIDGKTSIGLKPNIAAALSYALIYVVGIVSSFVIAFLLIQEAVNSGNRSPNLIKIQITALGYMIVSGIIALGAGFIFFIMEKESRFVRLHSMQAILFGLVWYFASLILGVIQIPLTDQATGIASTPVALLATLVSLTFLVIWILLPVKAYKGEMLKLPIISDIAENIVTK